MPLVNRLLDAFFRTLDAVDAARERLDRVLGREPAMPGPVWDTEPRIDGSDGAGESFSQRPVPGWTDEKAARPRPPKAAERPTGDKAEEPASDGAASDKAVPKKARKGKAGSAAKAKAKKASRKGSVDRTGADFDSPRARAVLEQLVARARPVVAEHAALDNKKVLARVVWALGAAQDAGSAQGLTAADASALLHLAAGVDVFSTNIARTCREETDLIEEGEPDGRIKRYRLTSAGRRAAESLATRPPQ